jgi:hypothetical protein
LERDIAGLVRKVEVIVRYGTTLGSSIMTAADSRTELTAAQDRLLALLVQQDEASNLKDWTLVNALEEKIETARMDRNKLQQRAD